MCALASRLFRLFPLRVDSQSTWNDRRTAVNSRSTRSCNHGHNSSVMRQAVEVLAAERGRPLLATVRISRQRVSNLRSSQLSSLKVNRLPSEQHRRPFYDEDDIPALGHRGRLTNVGVPGLFFFLCITFCCSLAMLSCGCSRNDTQNIIIPRTSMRFVG